MLTRPLALSICLLSGVFLVLGGVFLAAPRWAAGFYGLPTSHAGALSYVRAVGLRDLALAAYLLGLVAAGQRHAIFIVLLATLVIPMGDIVLLASSGAGRPVHFLLHITSLMCFAALALWSRASPGP